MNNTEPLKLQIPSQGGTQFLTARREMLDSYDKAKTHSKKDKVQVKHGNVGEAEYRKWLTSFLPKKYAVTSGYIISQGIPEGEKAPHYDVIIYDYLEAPILWVERNPDQSEQGMSRAIPAEYVNAVIEVKSNFSNKTVNDAIKHLSELKKLMDSEDAQEDRYKMYLPKNFFCTIVFFELRKDDEFDVKALNSIINGNKLKGFNGGIILRGESFTKENTGRLTLTYSATKTMSEIGKMKSSLLTGFQLSNSIKLSDEIHLLAFLNWNESNFSQYAFDMVALLNGTFQSGRLSSFHAMPGPQIK
jgi:hypothetical protein